MKLPIIWKTHPISKIEYKTINNETATRQFPDLGQDVLKYGGVKHVCEISTLPLTI